MKKIIGINYLHNHPMMENKLGVDSNHVIVDRNEWESICDYFNKFPEATKYIGFIKNFFHEKSTDS